MTATSGGEAVTRMTAVLVKFLSSVQYLAKQSGRCHDNSGSNPILLPALYELSSSNEGQADSSTAFHRRWPLMVFSHDIWPFF